MDNPEKSIQELSSTELIAEEILRDRQEIVALDKKRNSDRMGMRALINASKAGKKVDKVWLTVGPLLIKMPAQDAKQLLERDQAAAATEINKLRSDLKVKVNTLRDYEFKDPITGFSLNPLTRQEMNAVGQMVGRSI